MAHNVYQPGDLVSITLGTVHARAIYPRFTDVITRRSSRDAIVVRTMAGGEYVIVEAEEWGLSPARTLRVPIDDLEHRSA